MAEYKSWKVPESNVSRLIRVEEMPYYITQQNLITLIYHKQIWSFTVRVLILSFWIVFNASFLNFTEEFTGNLWFI